MRQELDVRPLIDNDKKAYGSGQRVLLCPNCGAINSHVNPPYMLVNSQWHGDGALCVTPISSECGSEWELCVGEHKGDALIFARVSQACR
jgi:hypothetical protein